MRQVFVNDKLILLNLEIIKHIFYVFLQGLTTSHCLSDCVRWVHCLRICAEYLCSALCASIGEKERQVYSLIVCSMLGRVRAFMLLSRV